MNQAELVRASQAGDTAAQNVLFEQSRPRVMGMAIRHTRNLADAEDLTQKVLLKAFHGLPTFRLGCSFSTWLYIIMRSEAVNVWRHNKLLPLELTETICDDEPVSALDLIADQHPDPQQRLEIAEKMAVVQHVVGLLSKSQARAFDLRSNGMTFAEVAETMSISEAFARNLVFRAHQKMRREFVRRKLYVVSPTRRRNEHVVDCSNEPDAPVRQFPGFGGELHSAQHSQRSAFHAACIR